MKKAKAQLRWSLDITCPHCGYEFDLADHDVDGWISGPLFNNKWEDLKGEDVECPECTEEFQIEEVEY